MHHTSPSDNGNMVDLAVLGVNPPMYYAHDFVAMNDSELWQYLEKQRLEIGMRSIDVKDPDNLPTSFIERLRGLDGRMNVGAVDLDQVSAKLRELPSDYDPSRRFASKSESDYTLSPIPDDVYAREGWEALVQAGGRPAYPIGIVNDVLENPIKYRDLLRPWQEWPDNNEPRPHIFGEQLRHWKVFRGAWQVLNRTPGLPRDRGAPSYNLFVQKFRGGSLTYTESMRNLLAQYGFDEPFKLHDDPNHQDAVETWIEYLGFICAAHYRYNLEIEESQTIYDEAWKKIVDSFEMEPFETEEYVRTFAYAIQTGEEKFRAYGEEKRAQEALEAVLRAENGPQGSGRRKKVANARIREAQTRLSKAKEAVAYRERRCKLLGDFALTTEDYQLALKGRKTSKLQIQWALEQLPLVVDENKKSNTREDGPDGTNDVSGGCDEETATKGQGVQEIRNGTGEANLSDIDGQLSPKGLRTKRTRDETVNAADDDTPPLPPPQKRQRSSNAVHGAETEPAQAPQTSRTLRSRRTSRRRVPEAPRPHGMPRTKDVQTPSHPPAPSPPLRRSARIAARNARKGQS